MAIAERKQNCEQRIIDAIRKNNGIRIKDLARILGMWDSNLRKRINVLVKKDIVERFVQDGYTCVRVKVEREKR